MAGFDAGEIASRFDYDLREWGGKGRVPMPTDAEVRKFWEAIYSAQEEITGIPMEAASDEQVDELLKRLNRLTADERDRMAEVTLDAVVEICKGHPSRDDLMRAPAPVKFAFLNWLSGELNPLY